jgi:cobalamin-dependent methionine synthase I
MDSMNVVSDLFSQGKMFCRRWSKRPREAVAHLLLHQAEKLLLEAAAPTSKRARSSTVKGDVHDIGTSSPWCFSATTSGGEHGRDGALP